MTSRAAVGHKGNRNRTTHATTDPADGRFNRRLRRRTRRSHPWGYEREADCWAPGMPLFDGLPAPLHLELVEAHTYPTGAAIHVYRPRESAAVETIED
jgi:hypothetical protein